MDPEANNYYSVWGGAVPDGINRDTGNPTGSKYEAAAGKGDKPVNNVNFWDAARFANWLHLGQPSTTPGAGYPIDIDHGAYDGPLHPPYTGSNNIPREAGWRYAVASRNEWYKAAYYDPSLSGGAGGYYDYPTRSNTAPSAGGAGGSNSANYDNAVGGVTAVGTYVNSASYYGTFDQGGNVEEWTDTITDTDSRVVGGGYYGSNATTLHADSLDALPHWWDSSSLGFRVVSSVSLISLESLALADLEHYASRFAHLPKKPVQVVNDTGVPWRGFRMILTRKDQSQDDPHIRFEDLGDDDRIYTGPGTASFFDRNGDPLAQTEVMRVDGLRILPGDTLRFLVDILGRLGQEGLLEFNILGEPIPVRHGDADADGDVDDDDLSLTLANWGTGTAWAQGDFKDDDTVNDDDLSMLLANWDGLPGSSAAASANLMAAGSSAWQGAAIPEPATLGLLALGGMGMLCRNRSRGSRRQQRGAIT